MKYLRTASLKRLFSLKRHNLDEESPKECDFNAKPDQESLFQKPIWKCFSFEEIFAATNGFSSDNLVGRGGFAEVYKGVLQNGEAIAVKRLTKAENDAGKEKEFLTEIGTLGHVSHLNVTPLLGCCIDNGLYLIFQFSSKGSVASILHDGKLPVMDWKTRHTTAVGTARGLHYLHKNCPRRIIHRDIKASNVLLTADCEPQISDFGLAKWLPTQGSHHSIGPIEGTIGHLAPEYFMHGVVDEKTDVFAFGVFLLELISGRKPVDSYHQSLHSWAGPILNEGNIKEVVDPRLEEIYDIKQLNRLAFAASLCIRSSPTWRPTMSEFSNAGRLSFLVFSHVAPLHNVVCLVESVTNRAGPNIVLEVMLIEEEIDKEKWRIPEEDRDNEEEFWGFDDLEFECDSSFSTSPHDSNLNL